MSNEINNITSIEEAESMIATEEEKKQSIYLDLGKQYFLRHSSDCEPELKSYVDELVACSGTIAEINQRILALKGPTCPTCGMPVNEDSFFCSGCGTRLKGEDPAPEEPAEPADVIICPQCGSEMKSDMRFCTVCGCPIVDQDNAPQTAPTQEYVPQPQPEPVEMNEPAAEQDPYYANEPVAEQDPYYVNEPVAEQDPYYANEPVAEQDPYYANEPVAEQDPYYANEPVAVQESYDAPDSGAQPRAYVAPEPSNICPVCGAVSAPGISYCVNCGQPLEEDAAPAEQADYGVRRCPNCGFISSDPGMPFCTECGTLLS